MQGMMGVRLQSADVAGLPPSEGSILLHSSANHCEGPESLSCLQVNRFMFAGRRHEVLGTETKDLVWTASGLSFLFGLAPTALQVPQGLRGSGGFALQLRSPEPGESTAVTVNCEPACLLSGGEVTSSFKVACYEQNPAP